MNFQSKQMLKRSGVSPNQIVRNKILTNQFLKVKQKSLEKIKIKQNIYIHQRFRSSRCFCCGFFSAQATSDPQGSHLPVITPKASSQQSEPSFHLARCGGGVTGCGTPRNGHILKLPPHPAKSHYPGLLHF